MNTAQMIVQVAMDEQGLKARYVALQDALDVMPASQQEAQVVIRTLLNRTRDELGPEGIADAEEMYQDRHCEERVSEHESKIGRLDP